MRSNSFTTGKDLLVEKVPYVITNIIGDDGMYQLSNKQTGMLKNMSRQELLAGYARGAVSFATNDIDWAGRKRVADGGLTYAPPLDALGDKARAQTKRRRTYISRLDRQGVLRFDSAIQEEINRVGKEIGDPRPPHRSTVHRWYKQFVKRQRNLQALACRYDRRGGRGEGRFDDEVEEIVAQKVDEIYLDEQRNTALDTWEAIDAEIRARNLQRDPTRPLFTPSLRTIQRRVSLIPRYEVVARREGERAAKRKFRQVTGMVKVSRILERVEMDHTPLNLFVVDQESWLPLGRPVLTVAIDRRSRSLLGYWLSFTGNGADAVLACLRHSILPKTYVGAKYPHIKLPWEMYGIPMTLWVDNAMEFAGNDLKNACDELGIDLFFLPARRPEWKGSVERFLKTFNHSLIHRIPGTTFENITARGDYDPQKHALIGLADLERLIHTWVCDVYHNQVHRGLKARPVDVWANDAAAEPPALPSDVKRLDFQLGESEERTLWHYGVELFGGNQRFNSSELSAVFHTCGKVRVRVRFHRRSIATIWVEDPVTKEFFPVPNTDQEYSNDLTLEQHQFITKRAKADATGRVDRDALLAAKAFLRSEVQRLLTSKALRDRRKGARTAGHSVAGMRSEDSNQATDYFVEQQKEAAAAARPKTPRKAPGGDASQATPPPHEPRSSVRFTRRDPGAYI
jgi:putative transposase